MVAKLERNLAGGTALVTGGSSGIGLAVCHALAQSGVRVIVTGRDPERTRATCSALPNPEWHHWLVGDLADDDFLRKLVERCDELAQGQLAALVHAAGVHDPKAIEASSGDDFDATFATNLRAPFLLSARLLPALRSARGQIVFVNSSATRNPRSDTAAYSASKAGLLAFADSLRATVNPDGIRVLSVFPGRTATPMQREQLAREGRAFVPERLLQPEDVAASILAAMALPRTAEVTEIHIRPNLKA